MMSPNPAPLDDVGTTATLVAPTITASEEPPSSGDGTSQVRARATSRYRIRGEHARGGLGRVLRAEDAQLKRTVAIKELLGRGRGAEQRFEREVLLTARLEHPSIVPVHELGRWDDGRPYYSMKLISGRTLRDLVRECATMRDRLALVPNVLAVAEAIAYAHSQGVIHRDLKPANVIIGAYGETVVIDWGLAKDLAAPDAQEHSDAGPYRTNPELGLTALGDILGTPAYMPPEQAAGERVDERADIYALGAMLYRVLAGRAPFKGQSSLAVLEKVRTEAPDPVEQHAPDAPAELVAIVRKAMARTPRDRYAKASELADDLKRYTTGQLVRVYDYSIGSHLRRFARRHRAAVAVAAAMTVVLLGGGAWSIGRIVAERDRAETERARAQGQAARAKAAAEELVLTNAESWLERDPTTAFAWLKRYAADAGDWQRAHRIAVDAFDRGVARDVIQMNDSRLEQVRWSPDGQWIATADFDGVIGVWNVQSRRLRRVNADAVDSEEAMVFSLDSQRLYFATRSDGVAAYELAGGQVTPLPAHRGVSFYSVAISASGRYLAGGTRAGEVVVWDLAQHTSRVRQAHAAEVVNMEFAGDVALVSRSWRDGAIWNLESDELARLEGHRGEWTTVRLSPDQQTVATASRGGQIKLWRRATGTLLRTFELSDPVYEVRYGDEHTLFYSRGDDTVRKLDVRTGDDEVMNRHPGALEMFAFQPGGSLIASIDFAGNLDVWPRAGGARSRRTHRDREIRDLAFSPDGAWLAAGGEGGRLYIWAAPTVRSRESLSDEWVTGASALADADGFVTTTVGGKAFVATPDGEQLAVRRVAHVASVAVRVLATKSQRLVIHAERSLELWPATTEGDAEVSRAEIQRLLSDTLIASVGLARAGDYLAAADADGNVYVWRLGVDGTAHMSFHAAVGTRVAKVAISDEGTRVVALRPSGELVVWDGADGSSRLLAGPASESAHALAISDDGRYAVGATSSGVVAWNLDTGATVGFERATAVVTNLRFAAGEPRALMITTTGVLHDWDLALGRVASVALHAGPASGTSVSPVGARLATAGRDGLIRLVDLDGGAVRTLYGHDVPVDGVDWSRDARHLVSRSGQAGRTLYWDLTTLAPVPAPVATGAWLRAQSNVVVGASASRRALSPL